MSTPRRDFAALEARRLQAARLFARGTSQAAVAQQPGVKGGSGRPLDHACEARGLQAARLFARGTSQAAVAQQLGVTRVSAHHWYHAWKAQGRPGLKAAGRAGRQPQLNADALDAMGGGV